MFDKIKDALKNPEQFLPGSRRAAATAAAAGAAAAAGRRNVRPPVIEPFTGTVTETASPQLRQPDMFKGNIDHSGHLRLLARNDAEAVKLSIDALTDSRQRLTVTIRRGGGSFRVHDRRRACST